MSNANFWWNAVEKNSPFRQNVPGKESYKSLEIRANTFRPFTGGDDLSPGEKKVWRNIMTRRRYLQLQVHCKKVKVRNIRSSQ